MSNQQARNLIRQAALSEAGISRRGFLIGSSAAAAAVGIGWNPLAPAAFAAPKKQPSIAVVGAGISGMTAAMTLRDAGFTNVTVYESSDRVGGRIFTQRDDFFGSSLTIERGGEFIDTDHKMMQKLAARFGFPLVDLEKPEHTLSGATDTFFVNGEYFSTADFIAQWQQAKLKDVLKKQLKTVAKWPWAYDGKWSKAGKKISNMTIAAWIEKYVPGGLQSDVGKVLDAAYNPEFGDDVEAQSALDLIGLLGYAPKNGLDGRWQMFGSSDERFKIAGGNQQLVQAQADELGSDRVALGHTLVGLRDAGKKVTLEFAPGAATSSVTVDRVILALPLGVMKKLLAEGAFAGSRIVKDARKVGSIRAMGFGANTKLHVELTDRKYIEAAGAWGTTNGTSYTDLGYQSSWEATRGMSSSTGVMTNYSGGSVARAINAGTFSADTAGGQSGAVTGLATTFLTQVDQVFPGTQAKWTGKAQVTSWDLNPHSLGAYSYYTPGYCEKYNTYERVALGPIHFTGEHTSQDWQGYMEGGAVEGARAAKEIIKAYK